MQLHFNIMSPSHTQNSQFDEWKGNAKSKLKQKLLHNIQNRIKLIESIVNNTIKSILFESFKSMSNKQNINEYNELIQPFQVSQSVIDDMINEKIYPSIEKWNGVDVESLHFKPKKFDDYFKKALSYLHTNSAKWIGNFLFYPLLKDIIPSYICNITKQMNPGNIDQGSYNLQQTDRHSDDTQLRSEVLITNELIQAYILKEIINGKIKFQRTKFQSLILDQAYKKSKLLKQWFIKLGKDNELSWALPPSSSGPVRCFPLYCYIEFDLSSFSVNDSD